MLIQSARFISKNPYGPYFFLKLVAFIPAELSTLPIAFSHFHFQSFLILVSLLLILSQFGFHAALLIH